MKMIDKQKLAYGFISATNAYYTDDTIGGLLGEVFIAVDEYEDFIEKTERDTHESSYLRQGID